MQVTDEKIASIHHAHSFHRLVFVATLRALCFPRTRRKLFTVARAEETTLLREGLLFV